MNTNEQTMIHLRAEQEADRLLGMRPDLAKAHYNMLLAKVLGEKAQRLASQLTKQEQPEVQSEAHESDTNSNTSQGPFADLLWGGR